LHLYHTPCDTANRSIRRRTRLRIGLLQKVRDESCSIRCHLVGKHRTLTESRLFAANLSVSKTTGAKKCEMGLKNAKFCAVFVP